MCRLSAESLGQVFPVCELWVVHVQGTVVCACLEDEGFIEGFVHVCIHTFSCGQDEIVSGPDDSWEVCIHTFCGLDARGHEVCIHTYPRLRG